jgi:hypothetical protein
MARFTAEKTEERETWVRKHFMKDPQISGPEMNKLIKKELKASMRATRIYELRDEVLKKLGWKKDRRGNPQPPNGHYSEQANREAEGVAPPTTLADPLIGRCVIPVEDVTDGVSFQQKIQFMNEKGFLKPKVNVEAVTGSYVIISHGD